MAHIVNDHFVPADFIYDQIVADGQSAESRFARRYAHVRRLGDPSSRVLDAGDKACCSFSIVLCYVRKNLVEIGESAAFIPQLHALR